MNVGHVAIATLGVGWCALQVGACGGDEDAASDDDATAAPRSDTLLADGDFTDPVPTDDVTGVETSPGETLADCSDLECQPFEHCASNGCVAYGQCWFDGTCDSSDEVCRAGHCVPGDVDIDRDGSQARDDCDEANAAIHPFADEGCNGADDDCDGETDEGDAAAMCDASGTGDRCQAGACACADDAFDVDPEVPGCECPGGPSLDQGFDIISAIDLGDLPDVGAHVVVEGTLQAEREVWYHFRGVDVSDWACDNYHVRVFFGSDPESAYEFNVCRGGVFGECLTQGLTDYTWATDYRTIIDGQIVGQCPCHAPGHPVEFLDECASDTAEYFVRVRRRPGTTVRCSPYSIDVSNGLYDTL